MLSCQENVTIIVLQQRGRRKVLYIIERKKKKKRIRAKTGPLVSLSLAHFHNSLQVSSLKMKRFNSRPTAADVSQDMKGYVL